MFQLIFRALFLFAFSQLSLTYYLFQSKYPAVEPKIEEYRAKWPNERTMCGQMLRCTINGVPGDYPARWSAGASILAFIPTIVGLMSNSVDEITAIAEVSIFLAINISLSSVTVFSSWSEDKIPSISSATKICGRDLSKQCETTLFS